MRRTKSLERKRADQVGWRFADVMLNRRAKLTINPLAGILAVLVALAALSVFSRIEVSRFSDPSGNYTAVVSKRNYQNFVMRMPGQGSDAPGYVEIFGRGGESFGRIPIEMLQMADVRWSSSGAEIRAVAEWDFGKRTCYYWSEDGQRQVWVRR